MILFPLRAHGARKDIDMAFLNEKGKEVAARIVYFGPELAGKRANLNFIYENYDEIRGRFLKLSRKGDSVLLLELTSEEKSPIKGFTPKLHLVCPNEVTDNSTWAVMFRGVDGVIFVADSQEEKLDENKKSLKILKNILKHLKVDPKKLPIVMQFNKCDLPDALGEEDLDEEINEYNAPFFSANAVTGVRVEETFMSMAKLALRKIEGENKKKNYDNWFKYTDLEEMLKKNYTSIEDYTPAMEKATFSDTDNEDDLLDSLSAAAEAASPEIETLDEDDLDALLAEDDSALPAEDMPTAEENMEELFDADAESSPLDGAEDSVAALAEKFDVMEKDDAEDGNAGESTVKMDVSTLMAKIGGDAAGASATIRVDRAQLKVDDSPAAAFADETPEDETVKVKVSAPDADTRELTIPLTLPSGTKQLKLTLKLDIKLK